MLYKETRNNWHCRNGVRRLLVSMIILVALVFHICVGRIRNKQVFEKGFGWLKNSFPDLSLAVEFVFCAFYIIYSCFS